jgi:hypothetical protein
MKFNRGKPDHLLRPAALTPLEVARACWGLGFFFLVWAVIEWLYPSTPSTSSKWGWLFSMAHELVGLPGEVVVDGLFGVILIICGCGSWLESRPSRTR